MQNYNDPSSLPAEQKITTALQTTQHLINKGYLSKLDNFDVVALENHPVLQLGGDVRIFQIERLVLENKQSILESTTAAYTALGAAGYSVFLFLDSDGHETTLYIGTRGEPCKTLGQSSGELLQETFKGHFPGSKLKSLPAPRIKSLLSSLEKKKGNIATTVTAVSSVPSLSTESQEHFMQGLERFIDAAENRVYQGIILAEPVSNQTLDQVKAGYEQVSTQLSSIARRQFSYGIQDSNTVSQSLSQSLSTSLGESLSLTESKALTEGTSDSKGESQSTTTGTSAPKNTDKLVSFGMVGLGALLGGSIGANIAGTLGKVAGGYFMGSAGANVGAQVGSMFAATGHQSSSTSTSKTHTDSHSETLSTARGKTTTETTTKGTTNSESLSNTTGNTQQFSFEVTDKTIECLLEKIDHHLNRIDEAKTFGGWNTAAYFISDGKASSEALASIFLGLVRGHHSSTEDFALTSWSLDKTPTILDWLGQLTHPRLNPSFSDDIAINYLTPATLVSGKEMALELSLPRRSTSTVIVQETKAFGRKVQSLDTDNDSTDRKIELGRIRHLWSDYNQRINLSLDNLASHLFVTGSTGAGKSNTIYNILGQLSDHNIPFLVIEPAKGEYKHVVGSNKNVRVFGTNSKHTELLKINPFSFPEETHVLEHVDRLIEIFTVCWAMYAAMPAMLKDAILSCYERCGWNLVESTNNNERPYFPTFTDLLLELEYIIENSSFSQEVKSNYAGALTTRIRSLANGLNGQIFCANELNSNDLFDTSVIVDLSRVGSQETKSLIMGLLLIKLSEHRSKQALINQPLRHVTVLEEAHNLLGKVVSSAGEGGNLSEKSIEMLTNAIAEMRTYGEGFIIADQSPTAVHSAAIKNTNTKIIMRLPDETDRVLAGKSAGLSDEQITELAKLPKGVAVVYQNDWLEAVLCKVNKFADETISYSLPQTENASLSLTQLRHLLVQWLLAKRLSIIAPINIEVLRHAIYISNLPTPLKIELDSLIKSTESDSHPIWEDSHFSELARLVVRVLDCQQELMQVIMQSHADFNTFIEILSSLVERKIGASSIETNLAVQHCFMKLLSTHDEEYLKLYDGWNSHVKTKAIA